MPLFTSEIRCKCIRCRCRISKKLFSLHSFIGQFNCRNSRTPKVTIFPRAGNNPPSITEPIRAHLAPSAQFVQGKCTDVDFNSKTLQIKGEKKLRIVLKLAADDGTKATMAYDYLVISVGAFSNTFGVPGVKENCLFLKSIEGIKISIFFSIFRESRKVRDNIMACLEKASFPSISEEERKRLCSFLVVGGGPTGMWGVFLG